VTWFETVESRTVCEGPLSRVRVDRVRTPNGEVIEREVVEHADAAAVVPLRDDGAVVLLRHYRQPFRSYQLEIPAGKLDVDGEATAAAVHRELREETGLEAARIEQLTVIRNSAGWTDEVTYMYLATGLRHVGVPEGFAPEAEEAELEIVVMPLDAAVSAVHDGTITDAKTVVGILLTCART
jgi:8-oxo-dGDP phosphatase